MFFRNDDPGPLNTREADCMRRAQAQFHTTEEVRFGTDTRILAPLLNTLTEAGVKYYLIHLPDGLGWALRRTRPTGAFHGRTPGIPGDARTLPDASHPANAKRPGTPPADPAEALCYAEEYFGDGGAAGPDPDDGKAADAPGTVQGGDRGQRP